MTRRRHFIPENTAWNASLGFPDLGVGTGLGTTLTEGTKRIARTRPDCRTLRTRCREAVRRLSRK